MNKVAAKAFITISFPWQQKGGGGEEERKKKPWTDYNVRINPDPVRNVLLL